MVRFPAGGFYQDLYSWLPVGTIMGARLYLEHFVWFDSQIRKGRYPNATKLALAFECSVKTAQRTIETFRDRFSAPIEYPRERLLLPGQTRVFLPGRELPTTSKTTLQRSNLRKLLIERRLLR